MSDLRKQAKTPKQIWIINSEIDIEKSLWVPVEVVEDAQRSAEAEIKAKDKIIEEKRKEWREAMRLNSETFMANKEFLEKQLEAKNNLIDEKDDFIAIQKQKLEGLKEQLEAKTEEDRETLENLGICNREYDNLKKQIADFRNFIGNLILLTPIPKKISTYDPETKEDWTIETADPEEYCRFFDFLDESAVKFKRFLVRAGRSRILAITVWSWLLEKNQDFR